MSQDLIIKIVKNIQLKNGDFLECFRILDKNWINSGLDENNPLYNMISYIDSSLDHIPSSSSRHLFSHEALIKYDADKEEFFKFHEEDIEKFCNDFFQYINKKKKKALDL